MSRLFRLTAPLAAGLAVLGLTAAAAGHRDGRPPYCAIDHDHRAHHHDYYDYHPHDRYYRAEPYSAGASVTARIGGPDYDGRYYEGRSDYRRAHPHRGSKVVKRRVFDTRYRARIVLVEELFYGRRGRDLVCTVSVHGPDARYVPWGRVRSIAARNCSRRAEVRYYA
ncbi:hypothetical protein [Amphiplicatus metriothermophilus]|uniref:Secreted protein n=1 Tax=Amphiplicatus metriothermophilus TaxID=1519374 RepID=A0A239PZA1_9PROT|nr:hypothetical protein [Amphiplicatus metriothermophilus]MBB5518267.1 hypothetical protein [Amphiplicatus metriothermophilus]SNT75500.1 hypothetical protein SAMN06297382_2771 [Amphiplicatus metriothermophilus]